MDHDPIRSDVRWRRYYPHIPIHFRSELHLGRGMMTKGFAGRHGDPIRPRAVENELVKPALSRGRVRRHLLRDHAAQIARSVYEYY
jgi:hypothetical protein